jgi:hypothetical protein
MSKINSLQYAADRYLKLSKLMKELRVSPTLFSDFQKNANDVAKQFGLALTEDERDQIAAAASAPVSDELSTDALEAAAGGDGSFLDTCPVNNGCNSCPAPDPGTSSW